MLDTQPRNMTANLAELVLQGGIEVPVAMATTSAAALLGPADRKQQPAPDPSKTA